ncbi:MAG: hypothetical protein KIT00_10820, partial [Rhodospirillales bacterium]|nr:hypothetical protein [Rhodospirillales bacterium]
FRSLRNLNGDEVIAENTDDNEQGQLILRDKSGPVMFAATADQGILLGEYAAAPGTPGSGRVAIYPLGNGRLVAKDDIGSEVWLSADHDGVTAVSATPYTVLATDRTIICTDSADVLDLPAAGNTGKRWEITNYTGSDITINRNGSDTIRKGTTAGATSITVADGNTVSIRDIAIGSDVLDVVGVYT